jgi:Protein of unknown function (DUF3800)
MHICYMDDSGDKDARAFSLIAIPVEHWKAGFAALQEFRRKLRESDGVYVRKELHATKFLTGHGRVSEQYLPLERRVEIYLECLTVISGLPEVRVFNAIDRPDAENFLFERLLNRLNRAMKAWQSHAIIVSDEGKDYTRLARKMAVFNPIPSKYQAWAGGAPQKNIVVDRLIDDLFYRKSHDSYFIQAADFCAYALLRSEKQIPSKNALGLHKAFDRLIPICQTQCYGRDPRKLGIIRVNDPK